jgi:hypothetical protein
MKITQVATGYRVQDQALDPHPFHDPHQLLMGRQRFALVQHGVDRRRAPPLELTVFPQEGALLGFE